MPDSVGAVISSLNTRRGTIVHSDVREDEFTVTAEVALNDMFGYSNALRGATQGKGEFSMEYKVNILSPASLPSPTDAFSSSRTTCQCCRMRSRSLSKLTRRRCRKPKSRARRSVRCYQVPVESRNAWSIEVLHRCRFCLCYTLFAFISLQLHRSLVDVCPR